MRKPPTSSGYSALYVLLVLIAIGIAGFTGWYVVHTQKETDSLLKTDSSNSINTAAPRVKQSNADPTLEWTSYTSSSGKFTVKYPKAWATASNPDLCANGIFLLGANTSSVGKCGSDDFGQMTITWRSDRQSCGDLNSAAWSQNSKKTVKVAGIDATKITGTARATSGVPDSVPEGTKTVQYCFAGNSMTYIVNYEQLVGDPDVLDDFNVMVTQTFKLN